MIAASLLRFLGFDPRFRTPGDIGRFAFSATSSALLSGIAAAGVYSRYRPAGTSFYELMRIWWFSDALGLLLVTPLAVTLWPIERERAREVVRPRWYDLIALAASLVVVTLFALARERFFHGVMIRPYVMLLPALYVASRFSIRATAVTVSLLTALALFVTTNGHAPFGALPVRETVISVQELIALMSVGTLGLSALLSQHRRAERELEERVAERTAALAEANTQLTRLATTDALTGLANRRAMFDVLHREIERSARYRRPLALVVFDIDRFKRLNDRYGHAAGDVALKSVASTALAVVRASDIVARFGGEEFAVIAPETDDESALLLAERLREALHTIRTPVDGKTIGLTASFGVGVSTGPETTPESLLKLADDAMYSAKAAGRDRVMTALPAPRSAGVTTKKRDLAVALSD